VNENVHDGVRDWSGSSHFYIVAPEGVLRLTASYLVQPNGDMPHAAVDMQAHRTGGAGGLGSGGWSRWHAPHAKWGANPPKRLVFPTVALTVRREYGASVWGRVVRGSGARPRLPGRRKKGGVKRGCAGRTPPSRAVPLWCPNPTGDRFLPRSAAAALLVDRTSLFFFSRLLQVSFIFQKWIMSKSPRPPIHCAAGRPTPSHINISSETNLRDSPHFPLPEGFLSCSALN